MLKSALFSNAKLFWSAWCCIAVLWVLFALVVFPETRRFGEHMNALFTQDLVLATRTDCSSVIDATARQACMASISASRDRRELYRDYQFQATMGTIGLLIGPPILLLIGIQLARLFSSPLEREGIGGGRTLSRYRSNQTRPNPPRRPTGSVPRPRR